MKQHILKRYILNYWRRRWVRVSVSMAVLGIVILIQYFASSLPQPQVIGEGLYSPAISKASQQKIVLRDPILSPNSYLLRFDGKPHQTVEFRAAKAKLNTDSLHFFQNVVGDQYSAPPDGFEEIEYLIAPDKRAEYEAASRPNDHSLTQSCLTFVGVSAIDGKLPTEIHFYQPDTGRPTFQALEISAIGADLEVRIHQSQPDSTKPEGNPWAAGCQRSLAIGSDWLMPNPGEHNVGFIVPANATFRLDFHALRSTSLHSDGELFEPFVLGDSTLKARALSVVPNETNGIPTSRPPRPSLSVEAAGESKTLDINSLKATDAELKLSFSGFGFIGVNGKAVTTLNLGDFVNRYPIIATIFGLVNLALIGWVGRNIFGNKNEGKTQDTESST